MKLQIAELVLRLAVLVMAGIVIPAFKKWLNAKTENEQFEKVRGWAIAAVYAAEQMYNRAKKADPDGTARKEYAMAFVRQICDAGGIHISDDELEALIEAVVITMDTMPAEDEQDE